jgi:CRISPR/Cas system-associated protein Csm6
MEVANMIDRYNRLPPEEQRIVIVTLFAGAAALWLAVAWEEAMVLVAMPVLAAIAWSLIRSARRRAERQKEEILY